ncbi:MAG TPA: hypothetical protein PLL33_04715 [Paracoccus sp. (in: a-proteobacteria)]|nr:hypothetical protein [Paracoccus sp. (in: a-proteobacteria)]
MLRPVVFCLAALLSGSPATAAAPFEARVIQSGHSLTDPIPVPLTRMLQEMGMRHPVIDPSTIPGSTMDWRWTHDAGVPGKDARRDIGNYDVLVLTERVPLSNTIQWHNSEAEALRWTRHAWKHGNDGKGAATVIYGSWVEVISGPGFENPHRDPEGHLTFRERMPLEMVRWEAIADHVNANLPKGAPPVPLIPGPLIMQAMAEAVAEGRVPGIAKMDDLFRDDIHVNDTGAYLIALAHYAVIYGRDPRELPDRIGAHGQEELAAFMQDLVARVIASYPRARPQTS